MWKPFMTSWKMKTAWKRLVKLNMKLSLLKQNQRSFLKRQKLNFWIIKSLNNKQQKSKYLQKDGKNLKIWFLKCFKLFQKNKIIILKKMKMLWKFLEMVHMKKWNIFQEIGLKLKMEKSNLHLLLFLTTSKNLLNLILQMLKFKLQGLEVLVDNTSTKLKVQWSWFTSQLELLQSVKMSVRKQKTKRRLFKNLKIKFCKK